MKRLSHTALLVACLAVFALSGCVHNPFASAGDAPASSAGDAADAGQKETEPAGSVQKSAPQKDAATSKVNRDEAGIRETDLDAPSTSSIRAKTYGKFKVAHYDATPDQIVRAAGKLFALADVDYDIAYGRGALLASRTTTLTGYGTGTWYVQATPNGKGSDVMVRFGPGEEVNMPGKDIAGKWRIPKDWIAPSAIRPEELESGPALYTVFYKRMDYLLGQNRYWLDCLAAGKYVHMEGLGGELDPLCSFCDDVDPSAQ